MIRYILSVFVLVLLWSCNTTKPVTQTPVEITEEVEEVVEDENVYTDEDIEAMLAEQTPPEIYQSKRPREWKLLHTDLSLSFDWAAQRVNGEAVVRLMPWFYTDSIVSLDAKNFDIHFVGTVDGEESLTYLYDERNLSVVLGKSYTRTDTLELLIKYTAKPAERKNIGGAAAITSDQGLFFINHDGQKKGKPQQIWTQGETSYNSCWFPTIDAPNQRFTHEIKLEVQNRFTTLSNGRLAGSEPLNDSMRIDHWVMDMPHAPYLVMLAIGEYAVVNEKWNDMDLGYYVEPAYKDHAKDIFGYTPEMLDFFSELFGVRYPWQKYDQVVVRDFVSGAMENTTAVIFGDFVQRTRRQLMAGDNDKIVAHEMAHHWFGNLVTCSDWSQLTMNEGFANYSEYLWLEHQYGLAEAELHRKEELEGYLNSTMATGTKDLIRYNYENEEEMFDAHSYNKGGLVLHMLRNITGDEAFFASLQAYLVDNAYSAVEVHQLRLAFEKVTGIDYSWFFNQWFLDKGHPELTVDQSYDESTGMLTLKINQNQSADNHRYLFRLPIDVDIYLSDSEVIRERIWTESRSEERTIAVDSRPVDVLFDPEGVILGTLEEEWEIDEDVAVHRIKNQPNYMHMLPAYAYLAEEESEVLGPLSVAALQDTFWLMRMIGVSALPVEEENEITKTVLERMAINDPNMNVRYQALERLSVFSLIPDKFVYEQILAKGEKENGQVVGKALTELYKMDPDKGGEWQQKLLDDSDPAVITAICEILAMNKDTTQLDYVKENFLRIEGYGAITYMTHAFTITGEMSEENVVKFSDHLYQLILTADTQPQQRYGIMQYISANIADFSNKMREQDGAEMERITPLYEKLLAYYEKIVLAESNDQLKKAYEYLRP